jgi:hypothetical protein
MVVVNVSFGLARPAVAPKELVGRNHGGNVDVHTIYKETHSSDDPATRERHYAGWAADQDDAIRRANEIYELRDNIEAVVVIGNGPTGIEVVYRVEGEN